MKNKYDSKRLIYVKAIILLSANFGYEIDIFVRLYAVTFFFSSSSPRGTVIGLSFYFYLIEFEILMMNVG